MSEPFERAAVLARYHNDRELIGELVRLFAECSAAWLEEIRAALARGDLQAAMNVAHTLKGSVGNFLAHDVAASAAALETACKAGSADTVRQAFAATQTAVDLLNTALKTLLDP